MKALLIWKLNLLARLALKRFKPAVIGITGSVGKTSTKEAIYTVLRKKFEVRASIGSYNNEFGLPLTILGAEAAGKSVFKWLLIFWKSFMTLLWAKYPEVLILELGADAPGDIGKLLKVAAPLKVAVITDIGISHLQNYPNQKSLVDEKLSILEGLGPDGIAVLNTDNNYVAESLPRIARQKFAYGFETGDLRATDFQLLRQNGSVGINFKVHYKGTVVPFFIPNCLGVPSAYSALAAAATALALNLNLVNASEAMRDYVAPAGRLRLIEGIKRTWIIDDTYNAAPASTLAAINALNQVALGRKVVVIGDMAELGVVSDDAHKQIAVKIQESGIAIAVLVGQKGKIIFDELNLRKFSGKSFWYENSDLARMPIQNELVEGDTVLVKGSQAVRMERIVKEIMADPMNAEKLLVRQSASWLSKP